MFKFVKDCPSLQHVCCPHFVSIFQLFTMLYLKQTKTARND